MEMNDENMTEMLNEWATGSEEVRAEIFSLIEPELKHLSIGLLKNAEISAMIQPTQVVDDYYLKMAKNPIRNWGSRKQYFCFAAKVITNKIRSYARAERAQKRGSGKLVSLDEMLGLGVEDVGKQELFVNADEICDMEEGLSILAQKHPRQAEVIRYMYFFDLTPREIKDLLDISTKTIQRDCRSGLSFLRMFFHLNNTHE